MCTDIVRASIGQKVRHGEYVYDVIEITENLVNTVVCVNGELVYYPFEKSVYESLITFDDDFKLV